MLKPLDEFNNERAAEHQRAIDAMKPHANGIACPKCGADFLYEKRNKAGDITLFCHKKECGHKEIVTTTEETTDTH